MAVLLLSPGLTLLVAIALLGLYILSTVAYRLFLSPLAGLPGPSLAAASYWYECYYDIWQPARYVFKIKELHEKYGIAASPSDKRHQVRRLLNHLVGPVIRITPTEVSVADPSFLDSLYAPGPGHKRDKDIGKVKALGINTSIGGAVAHDLHRRRREALNPFFSHRSIARLASKLDDKAQQLEERFSLVGRTGEVVNLSDLYFAFSNDIVNEYCFGHSQDLLGDPALAHARRANVDGTLRGVKFNLHFSWVRDLMRKLPPSIGARYTPPGIRDMIRFRMRIRREIQDILNDDSGSNGSGHVESVFHELRDSTVLAEEEKSPQRLEDEGTLLVMAGTQSTQLSLTLAHYHLLANQNIMAKLREELASHPSRTLAELEQLPYLNGIIQEAHRLGFGLTGRNARVSPKELLTYTDRYSARTYAFPPGTSISISTLLVHANEDIFPDPFTFNPERWLGPAGATLRRYQLAFSKGPRMCIGMHLANAEMMVGIAAVAKWDLELFKTTAEDVAFLHDYHIATPRLDSKGVRVKVVKRAYP